MSGQFARPIDNDNKIYFNPYNFDDGVAYLTSSCPITFKYFDGYLFKLELSPDYLQIIQRVPDALRCLEGEMELKMYDINKVELYSKEKRDLVFDPFFEYAREVNYGGYGGYHIRIEPPEVFSFATVRVKVLVVDSKLNNFKSLKQKIYPNHRRAFTRLETESGILCVHKKTLSDNCRFFKDLFSVKQKKYFVNCQLMDLIELLYCLPPFDRRVKSGYTYGALFRLSEIFKCYRIGDLCVNYITPIRKYTPLAASFICYEGGVEEESELYLQTKEIYGAEELGEMFIDEFELRVEWWEEWHEMDRDCPRIDVDQDDWNDMKRL